ncbi:MAG: glycosyltransferase family protein [Lachnospiraceae bacterium]|nr:glycosyltransferase family protein [Lachnospiraceae bacterium]
MDDKRICFIACVNNDRYWKECLDYLSDLEIPDGYTLDLLEVRDAKSMCSGYNEAMEASDAKYKIYMHQDVFITDRYFLQELIEIFELSDEIGMVGLVGSIGISDDAVVWHGPRVGAIYSGNNKDISSLETKAVLRPDRLAQVDAVDGLLIATSRDIKWREDLFTGWDFYDLSQAQEFKKAGLKVVVPDYERPIAVHDDGLVLNLTNYDRYRKIFIDNYM